MNSQHGAQPTPQDWIGLYKNLEEELPEWVASAGYFKNFELGPVQFGADFMGTFLNPQVEPNARNVDPPTTFSY